MLVKGSPLSDLGQMLILLKLRIGGAIVASTLAGMAIAEGPALSPVQILVLALSVLLAASAAGGFNHYYDADIDAVMARTKNRPFATGRLRRSPGWLVFLGALLVLPVLAVAWAIHPLSALFVFLGAFFYGVVYTIWLKRRTWMNVVIGGLAGSFAILAGSTAVHPEVGGGPLAVAFVLFLWTPPHFWSLAIALKEDYTAAGIPMLPVVAGVERTAQVVRLGVVLVVLASLTMPLVGFGWLSLLGAVLGGLWFLRASWRLVDDPTRENAMASFRASLGQLALFLGGTVLDVQLLG
ncbi:MAG: protoheme IX farnesyltransferase [Magnetococcales bacterium]|nr:protoheme IX farnesyltransferase [Magnetococcales bacterium]